MLIIFWYAGSFLVMLVGSYHFDLLSQEVEKEKRGTARDLSLFSRYGMLSLAHSLTIQACLFFLWLLGSLVFIPLCLLPGGFLYWMSFATLLNLVGITVNYLDFPLSRTNLVFFQKLVFPLRDPMRTLGFGVGILVCSTVPGLGVLLMPGFVAGATLLFLDDVKRDPKLLAMLN